MGLVTLILIPLVAGYAFNVSFFVSRYASAREAGYRLYFRAAYYGAILVLVSALIYLWAVSHDSFRNTFTFYAPTSIDRLLLDLQNEALKAQIQLTVGLVISAALILGVTCGQILTSIASAALSIDNLYKARIPVISPFLRIQASYLKWVIRNDDFEKLLLRSVSEELQVSLTMNNGKVYVGYVVSAIDPSVETTHVRILPMRSGQRDEQGRIKFTTEYFRYYARIIEAENSGSSVSDDALFAGNYEIVLSAPEIISANIFLDEVYDHLREDADNQESVPQAKGLPGEFNVSFMS